MRTQAFALVALISSSSISMLGLSACDNKDGKAAAGPQPKTAQPDGTPPKTAKAAKEADAEAGPAKAGPAEAKDPSPDSKAQGEAVDAAPGEVALPDFGLYGKVPGEASVGESVVGNGLMVQGPDVVVTVEVASDDRPKTEAEVKKEADSFRADNYEATTLEDGWAVTYDNTGGMGPNYFVQVRREIGGTVYWCETTASVPEHQANALAFCKSLHK